MGSRLSGAEIMAIVLFVRVFVSEEAYVRAWLVTAFVAVMIVDWFVLPRLLNRMKGRSRDGNANY